MRSLGKSLLALALLHSVLQGQICLLLQVFLDFCSCILVPYNEKTSFWGVLEAPVGLHRFNLSFFIIAAWGIYLDYCDTEWFPFETNRSSCLLWDCIQVLHFGLVDYDGCSFSSKWFLPTVVELNSPIPVHFSSLIPRMLMFTLAISCILMADSHCCMAEASTIL